jgi:coatomer subunit beta'
MLLLGFVASQNRIYLLDRDFEIYSYELLQSVLLYQQAILSQDFDNAQELINSVPKEAYLKLAKFLEANDYKEIAYELTPDPTHKLDLAVELGKLDAALELAKASGKISAWKQVGDLALHVGSFDAAENCFKEAQDLPSLFLLYTSISNREGLKWIQQAATEKGEANLLFLTSYLLVSLKSKA